MSVDVIIHIIFRNKSIFESYISEHLIFNILPNIINQKPAAMGGNKYRMFSAFHLNLLMVNDGPLGPDSTWSSWGIFILTPFVFLFICYLVLVKVKQTNQNQILPN